MAVDLLGLYLRGLVAGFALLLTVVALVAYRRSPNRRLLFVGAALGLFAVAGGFMVYSGLNPTFEPRLIQVLTVLDVAILVMLYLSMVQPLRTHGGA